MIISRRKFVTGLIAAPAIVAASRLMPVKQMLWTPTRELLTADRTFYVVAEGVLGEDGVVDNFIEENGSPEHPFRTLQKAMTALDDIEPNGHHVTFNLEGTFQDLSVDLQGKAAFEVDLGRVCNLERCTLTGFDPERTAFEVRTGATMLVGNLNFTGAYTTEQLFKQKPMDIKIQKEVPYHHRFRDKWGR